jgi:hypothetical protein
MSDSGTAAVVPTPSFQTGPKWDPATDRQKPPGISSIVGRFIRWPNRINQKIRDTFIYRALEAAPLTSNPPIKTGRSPYTESERRPIRHHAPGKSDQQISIMNQIVLDYWHKPSNFSYFMPSEFDFPWRVYQRMRKFATSRRSILPKNL